jgi:hypothetical protein
LVVLRFTRLLVEVVLVLVLVVQEVLQWAVLVSLRELGTLLLRTLALVVVVQRILVLLVLVVQASSM